MVVGVLVWGGQFDIEPSRKCVRLVLWMCEHGHRVDYGGDLIGDHILICWQWVGGRAGGGYGGWPGVTLCGGGGGGGGSGGGGGGSGGEERGRGGMAAVWCRWGSGCGEMAGTVGGVRRVGRVGRVGGGWWGQWGWRWRWWQQRRWGP